MDWGFTLKPWKKILISMSLTWLQPLISMAGSLNQDLFWYRQSLQFSGFDQSQVESYLNPFVGPRTYTLSKKDTAWAGNYFPMDQGGLARRWQNPQSNNFYIYSQSEIFAMSPEEINHLSPIEKYDLMRADYRFKATVHELNQRGPWRPLPPENWEGFCNGVRCAGLILEEPKHPVTIKNKDGLSIRFEPADIKALAGASYFYTENYAQIGGPTPEGIGSDQPHPAVFDLALRYHLALNKKGFIIDSNLGPEIWNETVIGFKRELSDFQNLSDREKSTYPTATVKISVRLTLDALGEVDIEQSNQSTKSKVARGKLSSPIYSGYDLYLDINNIAVGGEWHRSESLRGIDFAWFAAGEGADNKYSHLMGNPNLKFHLLKPLLKQSAKLICANLLK